MMRELRAQYNRLQLTQEMASQIAMRNEVHAKPFLRD